MQLVDVGSIRSTSCLSLLTLALGYGVLTHGGDAPSDSSVTLLFVGIAAIIGSWSFFAAGPARTSRAVLDWIAVLLPAYIAVQLVPLPLTVLKVISPMRAELSEALRVIGPSQYLAPLAITPQNTWVYLVRIAACALILLVVRQIGLRPARINWVCAFPLIGIGALETFWAFAARSSDASPMSGTYFNKNHFAGLLEMLLPFTLMSGIAVLSGCRRRAGVVVWLAAAACGLLALAVLMFAAIGLSLSKMGFVSALTSLFVMALLGLARKLVGWKRLGLTGALVICAMTAFLFLSPNELVREYGNLAAEGSEGRMPIWKDSLRLIRAYPLFGIGLGNFYPGLLRYQTSGVDFAWTTAHNDYLQLLSELGIVGWLLAGGLMAAVFRRAAIASVSEATREGGFLGLACIGSLTAILLHSIADFNTYVLANAMTLSWVAGIAAALPGSNRKTGSEPSVATQFPLRSVLFAGGFLVSGYAAASLLFIHRYASDVPVERVFCRFGMCDTDNAFAGLRRRYGVDTNGSLPPRELVAYLPRDPAAPYRWEDLGQAMQKAGRRDEARYCFARAVVLAPSSPPTLLAAASFHLEAGDTRTALELISRSLKVSARFDDGAFATMRERQIAVDDVLRYVLSDQRSSQAYLRQFISQNDAADAGKVWEWIVARKYADDKIARDYLEFMLRTKNPAAAVRGWALYAGARSPGYPDSNRVFNGDFEAESTGGPFDWRIDATRAATFTFDRNVRHSGGRSLRIQFDGTTNPGEIGVEQTVFLKAGRYRFEAYVRTHEISTDQGVAFRLVYDEAPQQLDVTTEPVRGSKEWIGVERIFDAPPGGGLVRLSVVRKPSLKFDNLIRGTVWIDRVSIIAVEQEKRAVRELR